MASKWLAIAVLQPENCELAVTYQVDGNDVVVELTRTLPSAAADVYVAFGISKKKGSMNGIGIISCVKEGDNANAYTAVARGYDRPASFPMPSEVKTEAVSVQDGRLYCKVRRALTSSHPDMFDLVDTKYTLVLAEGVATAEGISKHVSDPLESASTVSLSSTTYAIFKPSDDDEGSHSHERTDEDSNRTNTDKGAAEMTSCFAIMLLGVIASIAQASML